MGQTSFSLVQACSRRLLSAAVVFGLLAGATLAQTVLEPPRAPEPGTSGVGGGAGLLPPLPQTLPAAPAIAPTLPPSAAVPAPLPTITPAPAAPAAPARVVRFRCDVAPGGETCREPGAPDGGGSDSECSCAKDICFDHLDPGTGKSNRMCEKSQ